MRISDWSSDVCSSDLKDMIAAILHLSADWISGERVARSRIPAAVLDQFSIILTAETDKTIYAATMSDERDRKSVVSGKSVSVRVDLGGRRIIKKKKNKDKCSDDTTTTQQRGRN